MKETKSWGVENHVTDFLFIKYLNIFQIYLKSYGKTRGKSIAGRGNSICKGHDMKNHLVYLRTECKLVWWELVRKEKMAGCVAERSGEDIYPQCSVAQSCLTLCDPMDYNLPGSSVYGILQAEILEWTAILFSRGSSWPRDQTQVSYITCKFFNCLSHQGSPSDVLNEST